MRCPSCEPDYCACADFYAGRLAYWKGEMMPEADECPCAECLAALSAPEAPPATPEGKFFTVFSPQGAAPAKVHHATKGAAIWAARRMAKLNPGQTFYVMKSASQGFTAGPVA